MSQTRIEIESLDMEARGVGHLQNEDGSTGKVMFVEGALPGELVSFHSFRRKSKWEAAHLIEVHRESALRVRPKCVYFGTCGGCAMQHIEPSAQVAAKQRVLEDNLKHIGRSAAGNDAAADPRPDLGLPVPRPFLGAQRAQEGRRAGRLP